MKTKSNDQSSDVQGQHGQEQPNSTRAETYGAALKPTLPALYLCALVVFLCSFSAHAQNYAIDWFKISGGGGSSAGGQFGLSGTIGQADAARSSGGNYDLEGGFWSMVAAIQTPGAPLLKVKCVGGNVEISWAVTDTSGFLLEETGSLAGTIHWSGVLGSPSVVNADYVVTVPATTGFHFYHLHKP